MASFLKSSIGKKFIQSVSGAFLVLFLLLHGTINFFSVIDSIKGQFGAVAEDEELYSLGDGYFKLGCDFMSTSFVDIMVPILALGFIVHICFGIWLSLENYRKRGGLKRYEVASKAKTDSWSAKNMFVLGIIVLGILAFHLTHFWAKMQLQDFVGSGAEENPYLLLMETFRSPVVLACYIVWFAALWLHLNHGIWSMFQSVGWTNKIWLKRLKVISIVLSTIICLAFVTVAVNAYLEAHGPLGQLMLP
ncbi:MAG: succinate dehydrogenase cytochrome b subunit [Bacteroidota bacterium]|nr:succinate dehydrogenase cytochrome b subunit [Bacteroidota bacterium]